MRKTIGNFHKISDLISEGFIAEEIRFILLSAHYRSKLNFSLNQNHEAKTAIKRVTDVLRRLFELSDSNEKESSIPDEFEEFKELALLKGFLIVSSSPLTRSSYHADKDIETMR